MKPRQNLRIILLCILLTGGMLLHFTGCSAEIQAADLMEGIKAGPVGERASDEAFLLASADFAAALFRNISASEQQANSLVSPLSAMLALAMTANGADTQTKAEMEKVLGGSLPIEELIRSRQQEYYNAFGASNRESDSSAFVELMLEIILDTLRETTVVGNAEESTKAAANSYIQKLLHVLGDEELSAAEIMRRLGLSHRPTFRKNYLNPALEQGFINRTIPDKPNSRNQKYRRR